MNDTTRISGTDGTDLTALLERCKTGDRTALRAIYDAEAPKMTGVAMRIVHGRDIAEDAVQDAFVQIWKNASKYDATKGSPRAWMYSIVRFRAIDLMRSTSREDAVEPQDLDKLRDVSLKQAEDGLDPDGRLHLCLQQLRPDHRHAVLLIYVTGMTQAEIAGHLAKPLGTIKSWLRRSLLALRECLQ